MTHTPCVNALPSLGQRLGASGQFTDPLWNKVWYLFKFEDAAGTTSPIDDSIYAHGMRFGTNSSITDGTGLFGSNALQMGLSPSSGCNIERSETATWINDDWTMEGHFFITDITSTTNIFFSQWDVPLNFNGNAFRFEWTTSGGDAIRLQTSNAGFVVEETITGAWTPTINTWYHISCQKVGTAINITVDGVVKATGTLTMSIHDMLGGKHQEGVFLGGTGEGLADDFDGKIDSARITLAERYTSFPFTLGSDVLHGTTIGGEFLNVDKDSSLLPLGAEVDSLFTPVNVLVNFEKNTGIGSNDGVPNLAYKGCTEVGDTDFISNRPQWQAASAGVSTVTVKHGSQSGNFSSSAFNTGLEIEDCHKLGANDFCMEAWVNFNAIDPSVETSNQHTISSNWIDANNVRGFIWESHGTGQALHYTLDGTNIISSQFFSVPKIVGGVWHHLAITRTSGTLDFYRDGTNVFSEAGHGGTIAYPRDINHLGTRNSSHPSRLRGFMDDYRLTLGNARYTGNFTPPGPLPISRFANERPLVIL